MSRRNRDEAEYERLSTITKAIKEISRSTEQPYSAVSQVEKAFLLGLWYRSFPEYTLEHLEKAYTWSHMELMPEGTGQYTDPYEHFLRFQFTADTGDSWHQCYRDFRELGWRRVKVHRDGGRLQYLLELKGEDKPEGFRNIYLVLDISISTCKQVQVGTETKEVPIMKTVCEDLVEIQEDATVGEVIVYTGQADVVAEVSGEIFVADKTHEPERDQAEVIPFVAVDDIEELQNRHEADSIVEKVAAEVFNDDYKAPHNEEDNIPL